MLALYAPANRLLGNLLLWHHIAALADSMLPATQVTASSTNKTRRVHTSCAELPRRRCYPRRQPRLTPGSRLHPAPSLLLQPQLAQPCQTRGWRVRLARLRARRRQPPRCACQARGSRPAGPGAARCGARARDAAARRAPQPRALHKGQGLGSGVLDPRAPCNPDRRVKVQGAQRCVVLVAAAQGPCTWAVVVSCVFDATDRLLEPRSKHGSAASLGWPAEAAALLQMGWNVSSAPFRVPAWSDCCLHLYERVQLLGA